ncbi:import receptor subunit tom-22 [Apiospora rasikravindrae]|uniref:Import receptor subunit tom-22 n=1 Tax=Apiospora rasikravindrae TaxID=990691 RepID=A0ABR1RXF1_9PEZI
MAPSPSEISEEAPAACAADSTATASDLGFIFTHDSPYLSGIVAPPNTPILTWTSSSVADTAELQFLEPLDPDYRANDVTSVNRFPPTRPPPKPRTNTNMVQLTEVVDEHFQEGQPGPEEDEDDFTDTDSEISNDSDYDPIDESFAERLYALRDIVPPHTRSSIANTVTATTDAVKSVLSFSGKTMWVLASSALVLGVPWALAWAEEQQVMEMEKEMKMREMGGEILTAGAPGQGGSATAEQVGAALGRDVKPAL